MEHRKIYTVIAAILGALYLYAAYNLVMSFVNGYSPDWSFLLYVLPVAAGLTGVLLFLTSRFKKSGLLRLCMCYEIMSFPFTVVFYTSYLSNNSQYNAPPPGWQFYMGALIDLLYMACCSTGLWYLSKRRLPKIIYYGEGDSRVGQFEPAGAGLRFANRMVDMLMIIFILLKSFSSLQYWVNRSWFPETEGMLVMAEVILLIAYYLLFEGIFNTTAGKCATNTTIVNEQGEKPGFAKILGRTFCRLIPFDALSFLGAGARGWHDSIPNTYVVETVDTDEAAMHEITLDAELNLQS
ncbi:MAG: RDD family protein [Ferruginibacter sp.]